MEEIKALKISTENGLNDCSIELAHEIEKELDGLMTRFGFSRTVSGKGGEFLEFSYRQFGKAVQLGNTTASL